MSIFAFGSTVAFIGIGVVFAELIFLVFVILGLSKITGFFVRKETKKSSETQALSQYEAEPASESAAEFEAEGCTEEELAVIGAAVSYMTAGQMQVRTAVAHRRDMQPSLWTVAGRLKAMNG